MCGCGYVGVGAWHINVDGLKFMGDCNLKLYDDRGWSF